MKHDDLVSDNLWDAIEPYLPKDPPQGQGRPARVPGRAAHAGIVLVGKSGIPWQMPPTKLGGGSGSTCWRRLPDRQEAGTGRSRTVRRVLPVRTRLARPAYGVKSRS